MSWHIKYPDWYASERQSLLQNDVYIEKKYYFEKFLVSCGEIIVRGKFPKRFPVLIFYPASTPYKHPSIYILKELLSEDELLDISKDRSNLNRIITAKKKLIYLRHQMSDGEVCFVEPDNLYKDHPLLYSIDTILNRISAWLLSCESGKYEFDSQEVEYYSHFPNKADQIRFLLPEIFYNPSLASGVFYL